MQKQMNVLTKMNASIEMVSNDVPAAVIRGDIQTDVGIATDQFSKFRRNHRECVRRYEQAHTTSGFCAGARHNLKALPDFIQGWSQSMEKLLSRFRKGCGPVKFELLELLARSAGLSNGKSSGFA